jgi:PHP family Zn ribbon phosphoesterase
MKLDQPEVEKVEKRGEIEYVHLRLGKSFATSSCEHEWYLDEPDTYHWMCKKCGIGKYGMKPGTKAQ